MSVSSNKKDYMKEYNLKTHYASQQKYLKENCKQVRFWLSAKDTDIIDFLDTKSNKAGYIKSLIRDDIKNHSDK